MIEESLDVALSKTCSGFDKQHYEKVQRAYQLLGKTQVSSPYFAHFETLFKPPLINRFQIKRFNKTVSIVLKGIMWQSFLVDGSPFREHSLSKKMMIVYDLQCTPKMKEWSKDLSC